MSGKATRIELLQWRTPQMRAFHLSWLAFFVCFFAWFSAAPLMPLIRSELHLDAGQVADIGIAAVAATVFGRLLIGPLCDSFGPRRVYTGLLLLGSLPMFGMVLVRDYQSLLLMRLAIGVIGASFVVTQYHTSVMFAPQVVGAANATAAGWGNAGGGAAQAAMPWILAGVLALGAGQGMAWRMAMWVPGLLMVLVGILYWTCTQDSPEGDYKDLRARGVAVGGGKPGGWAAFGAAARNYRVWLLFITYAGCFGIELFVHGVAASYYVDRFGLSLSGAGLAVGGFGLLALFARALGGIASDRLVRRHGLPARARLLGVLMLCEGLGLLWFSTAHGVAMAVAAMLAFGLFTHMACGATYALVPFVDRKALGGVAGIVGAGGNVGAVAAGFLQKSLGSVQLTFLYLGGFVIAGSLCALAVRFSHEHVAEERRLRLGEADAPAPAALAID
jgi:NNP family nitrate/nitrite transporter-like MFS transporter